MYTPLSLSEVSDSELVRKVKEDADSQAVTELMNRHSGIYHTCTKPYLNSPHFSYQESLDEKPYTIYFAALGYDPQRGAFGTFLGSVTRNRCLQIIKEKNKFAKNESWEEIDFDILPAQSLSLYSKLEARDGLENVMKVVKALPEKKQRIFTKRYLNHDGRKTTQKWEDIAKSEGQTKWACVLSTRTVEKKIREKMGKELVGRTY